MNRIVLAIVLILTATSIAATKKKETNEEHTKWIASVMDSIQTIKPGMTREDLLKMFTTEGGLSNRLHRTYVYKECPYIKVTVEFEAAENTDDHLTEMPEDKIVKISMPFLQYGVAD
jgi:uncharacterized membrane protein